MDYVVLTEDTRYGNETGAGIMRNRCAHTPRDMGADWPEAFTYAIVLGWHDEPDDIVDEDGPDAALRSIAARFDWDDELVAFLLDAHLRFKQLADRKEAPR